MPEVPGKTITFAAESWREKLLVSLEDITPLRGMERLQDIYIVTIGYNASHLDAAVSLPQNDSILHILLPNHWANQYFFARVTPVFSLRRGKKHIFPGGLPLFYDKVEDQVSFYFAVMESDQRQRDWGSFLSQKQKDFSEVGESLKSLLSAKLSGADIILNGYKLLIKGLETLLSNNQDDLRYANVFTFRKTENYLQGVHADWGNQRVALTIEVETPEIQIPQPALEKGA